MALGKLKFFITSSGDDVSLNTVKGKFYRKFLFAFCVANAFFYVACNNGTFPVANDEVRLQIGAEPTTLNPIIATDAYAGEVDGYLFDSLIERDKDTLAIKPELASSW